MPYAHAREKAAGANTCPRYLYEQSGANCSRKKSHIRMNPFFVQTIIPAALSLLFALAAAPLPAQTTLGGTTTDPSAELDVQSTTRGLLPPRLTIAQRDAIVNPATGLVIFNTTLNCVEMNTGTPSTPAWGCFNTANTVTAASATPTVCRSAAITPITHATTGATGIGTATGLPSGLTATWASNTITIRGTPTAAGIFNYTIPLTGGLGSTQATGTITVLANTVSAASALATVAISTAMTAITHTTTGATGIGTPSGLPAGITASWASNTITISGTPTASGIFNYSIPLTGGCGSVNATGRIRVSPAECGAYTSATTWITFQCHNLGAITSADPFTPDWRLNGHYYQWGRKPVAANGPTGPDISQANAGSSISGWNTSNAVNGSWADDSKTTNDPCPTGFKVPTMAQWNAVINTTFNPNRTFVGTWTNSSTNYSSGLRIGSGRSGLFLPAAGWRQGDNGTAVNNGPLVRRGATGYYWSSTEDGTTTGSKAPFFEVDIAGEGSGPRSTGMPVRCVAF